MISVEVQYQWPLQHVTSYQYSIPPQHTHKTRERGSVPVAPATRYFVLVLKITITHTRLGEKHKILLVMFLTSMYFPTHPCMHNVKLQMYYATYLSAKMGELLLWRILHPFSKPLDTQYQLHGSLCMYWPSDFLNNAHRDSKHCNCVASFTNIWGYLKGIAITLILRHESKFSKVKSLVSTHSACPCKNYGPRCSQSPCELFFYIFSTQCITSQRAH